MNGFNIVNYARFLIDAYGDPKWNDLTILGYANECIYSINNLLATKKSDQLLVKSTFNTVVGQSDYALTSAGIITANDFFRPYKLVNQQSAYGVSATLEVGNDPEIPQTNPGDFHKKAYPWYYIYDGDLVLGPTPTLVAPMEFWYFKKLTAITLGDTPTWMPDIYHPLLSYYAALRMTSQDKQTTAELREDYANKWQEYLDHVFGHRVNTIDYTPAGDTWA